MWLFWVFFFSPKKILCRSLTLFFSFLFFSSWVTQWQRFVPKKEKNQRERRWLPSKLVFINKSLFTKANGRGINCGDIVTWKHTFYCANSEGEGEADSSTRRRAEEDQSISSSRKGVDGRRSSQTCQFFWLGSWFRKIMRIIYNCL